MHHNSKDFKKLQSEWYKKLKSTGFEDIEDAKGRLDRGKTLNNIADNYDQQSFQLRQDYYRFAGQFLHEHKFSNREEKLIWKHHIKGTSIRDIVSILNGYGYKTYKRKVHETIQKLVIEMRNHVGKK